MKFSHIYVKLVFQIIKFRRFATLQKMLLAANYVKGIIKSFQDMHLQIHVHYALYILLLKCLVHIRYCIFSLDSAVKVGKF